MSTAVANPVLPKRPATYDDLCRVPEPFIVELIDGDLHVQPRPAIPHARSNSSAAGDLWYRFGRGRTGGWWILYEPELHLGSPNPRSLVLVPDIAGWMRDRVPVLPSAAGLEIVPDWVCEVFSPSSHRHDRFHKANLYARLGVRWMWLIDPLDQTLEVYELRDGVWAWIQSFEGAQKARARPFDAEELDLGDWWLDTISPAPPPVAAEPPPATGDPSPEKG